MAPIAVPPDKGEDKQEPDQQKRYLVGCDHCSFDEMIDGRKEATQLAETHQRETEHALVVVEWPR